MVLNNMRKYIRIITNIMMTKILQMTINILKLETMISISQLYWYS